MANLDLNGAATGEDNTAYFEIGVNDGWGVGEGVLISPDATLDDGGVAIQQIRVAFTGGGPNGAERLVAMGPLPDGLIAGFFREYSYYLS